MTDLEPTPDDVRNLILDAEVFSAAQGLLAAIPQWFTLLNDQHHDTAVRLAQQGDTETAAVFIAHDPVFDFDGIECASGSLYPCRALRAVHDGRGVWSHVTDGWPPGWERDFDEWDHCGSDGQEATP